MKISAQIVIHGGKVVHAVERCFVQIATCLKAMLVMGRMMNK
ncbi:hypothetical protein [Paenibacillus phage Pd_22F]|nr:hypothetical protein [Paenibacillus phage Pd_22F]